MQPQVTRRGVVAAVMVLMGVVIIARRHALCAEFAAGRTLPPYSMRAGWAGRQRAQMQAQAQTPPPTPTPPTPPTPQPEEANPQANHTPHHGTPDTTSELYLAHRRIDASARLIVVGDVHGMHTELASLLQAVQFRKGNDTLLLTGDLVGKGPDGPRVIRAVREAGGLAVRGNHDTYALKAATTASARSATTALSNTDLQYLGSLPYTLHAAAYNVTVVHAGVIPEVPLHAHPLTPLLTMRNIVPPVAGGHAFPEASDRAEDGVAWAQYYEDHCAAHPAHPHPHVVFGHDAKRGLQQRKFSTGVDTGCVYGNRLTAVIFDAPAAAPRFESVQCRTVVKAGGRGGG